MKKTTRIFPVFFLALTVCHFPMRAEQPLEPKKEAAEIDHSSNEEERNSLKALLKRGIAFKEEKKWQEAKEIFLQALQLNQNAYFTHYQLGTVYRELDQMELAIEHFKRALELRPGDTILMTELANTYNINYQFVEAIPYYLQVLEEKPQATAALYNIAYAIKHLGFVDEAILILEKIMRNEPQNDTAGFTLGLAYLMKGRFAEGWLMYEHRWKSFSHKQNKIGKKPYWDGSDLKGKTILLSAEQGLGDTFQFIRYAKILKNQGARVIFCAQKPLKTLLSQGCPYIDQIVIQGDPVPFFDVQIPLMSLPLMLNTTLETVPADIPYLYANETYVDFWREKMKDDHTIRIGVCWQGNANYRSLNLKHIVSAKSIAASMLLPLAQIEGVTLYSLQKINGADQLDQFQNGSFIIEFGPDFDESHGRFVDTAAVIKNLDLVITVDTSISHLAAALGTPTWIMLPNPADWRWMLNRLDTPWYPNVRLFRQKTIGDWQGLVQEVAQALTEFVKTHHHDINQM